MITVQTRQQPDLKKWWCNATINGYDHSFEGSWIMAVSMMQLHLEKKGYNPVTDCVWEEPKFYSKYSKVIEPPVKAQKSRIDTAMV